MTREGRRSREAPKAGDTARWMVWGGVLVVGVLVGVMAYHALAPVDRPSGDGLLTAVGSIDHEQPTHIHGIGYAEADDRLFIATHHGLFRLENATGDADRLDLLGTIRWDFMGFSLDATNGNRMFASGHPGPGENLGVVRSDDGGFTWERVWDGPDDRKVDFHSMALSPADPDRLVGGSGGIHMSADGGQTWETVGFPGEGRCWGVLCFSWDSVNLETLWVGTEHGLLRTVGPGDDWQSVDNGTFAAVYSHPADGRLWAWMMGGGIVARDEEGNWTRAGGSLDPSSQVFQFSGGPDDPDVLFAATLPGRGVYRTTDGGESWLLLDLV